MTLIINSILAGTWGLTAALVVVKMLGFELNCRLLIINTMHGLLLFGSSVYLLKTGIDVLQMHMSSTSGAFWINFLTWPFVFGILPQLLWFKTFRGRLANLAAIGAVWTITICFMPWAFSQVVTNLILHPTNLHERMQFSFAGYLEIVAVYTVLFAVIYYGLSRKNADMPLENNGELVEEQCNPAQAA